MIEDRLFHFCKTMGFNLIRQSKWALTKLSSWVLFLITKETQVVSHTPLILALSTSRNRSFVLLNERDRGSERIGRERVCNTPHTFI